jgi:hypothetical protein
MNDDKDGRLANTGRTVVGREVIDDSVLLADFERFLEIGEAMERGEPDPHADDGLGVMWELAGFIDRHGRQLLWLARKGAEIG